MAWSWVRPSDPTLLEARPLLDVGTGDGQTLAALVDRPGLVVGIDESRDALRAARASSPARLVAASAPSLPFRAETFGAILAADLFHHLDDAVLEVVLEEMQRVLTRDGRIVAWWYERPGRGGAGDPPFPRTHEEFAARIVATGLTSAPIHLEVVEGTPATVGAAIYRT